MAVNSACTWWATCSRLDVLIGTTYRTSAAKCGDLRAWHHKCPPCGRHISPPFPCILWLLQSLIFPAKLGYNLQRRLTFESGSGGRNVHGRTPGALERRIPKWARLQVVRRLRQRVTRQPTSPTRLPPIGRTTPTC